MRLAATAPRTNWADQLPRSIDAITTALNRLPLPLPTPQQYPRGAGAVRWVQRHYDVAMSAPDDPEILRTWFDIVEQSAPAVGARISEDANGAEIQIGVDGLQTHTLSLHWLGHLPRAALVLADLGDDLLIVREVTALGLRVTLAIDPLRPFAREVAELARLSGFDVVIALPAHAGADDATAAPALAAWLQMLDAAIVTMPPAVGVYVDSPQRLGLSVDVLRHLLAHARDRQLFALDATAEPHGRLCEALRGDSIPCVTRDVLLDPNGDLESTRLQLEAAMTLVHTRGDVVVVGSARPTILAAVRELAPTFAAAQVQIAPLSLVVADRRSLSGR